MRKVLIGFGVLLVLIAGAAALALVNLNSYLNRNKDWLAGQVEAALGRKVSFSEIGVQIFGGFGARIKDLRISDDPAYSTDDFVKAGTVEVNVELIPTLRGHPEVSRIVLEQPVVNVIRTKAGFNYDSIGKVKEAPPASGGTTKSTAPPSAAPPAEKPTATGGAQKSAEFLVSLIDIDKGQFRFVDRSTTPPDDIRIGDLDFSASDVSLDRPIHLKLATALFGASKQNLSVEGTLGPVGSPPNVQQAKLDLKMVLGPVVVDEMKKVAALAKALPPELSSGDPVTLSAKVSGTLEQTSLVASFDGSDAGIRYGQGFQKPKGVPLKLDIAADRAGNLLAVKDLSLRLSELKLKGKGKIDSTPGGPIDLQIDSEKTPLAGWDKLLPAFAGHTVSGTSEVHVRVNSTSGAGAKPLINGTVALDGVSAKQQGSPYEIEDLTSRIELKGAAASVPPTKFKLSGSPVEISAEIPSFTPLVTTFTLKSPELTASSLAFASPAATKKELLRGLDIKGQFRSAAGGPEFQGTLRSTDGSLRDFDYRDLAADLTFHDQIATLTKLSLRAFDGSYDGAGRYDMREKENPKFDFRSTIRDMDVKALLADRSPGSEKRIEGRLDADVQLAGSGKNWDAMRNQIRGDGKIDVRDGTIKDVNIADQVLQGVTGMGGLSNLISPRVRQRHPGLFATGDTKFDKLGGSVQIADGVARSDDLTISARDYAMLGKGTFALDNHLDFTASLVGSRDLSDDVISDVREAKYITNQDGKIEIPFRITGSLPNVKPKPDAAFITQALSRAVVGKGLEKIFGKEKNLPPGVTPTPDMKHPERELLKKGLEGLFGRGR